MRSTSPVIFVFALLGLAACSRAATPRATGIDASAPVVAVASVSAPATPPSARPSPATLTVPIAVRGYPHPIRGGMNDPASYVGWTKDGALFGYCATLGGRPTFVCELVDADGKLTKKTDAPGDSEPDPKKKAAILAWLRENGIPEIPDDGMPPPLVGRWPAPFADITLDVLRVEATDTAPASVRLGGAVGDEPAVHPILLSKNPVPAAPPHFAVMNGMALSPNGKELGVVAHFHACEYCESFDVKRIALTKLASSIYNDTGFRAHRKGDYARAAALFEKAIAAEPTAKLALYNYACALARLSDPRTKDALARAIAVDPSAKTRARADEDFAKVRSEPWFVELTR